jgi:phosphoserine phosphatase RsbU/P
MMDDKMEMLRGLSFLEGAGPAALERLSALTTERRFEPGALILEEGSFGSEVFLILEGQVDVVKGQGADEMLIATRGPGDLFGEMGLVERAPRFATIRAIEPTRLLELSEAAMRSLLADEPRLLYRIMQLLSARLREADLLMIADLQRKNVELAQAYRELQEAQAALVEKERLERELELARELQQGILPDTFPAVPGVNFAARSLPARQVGGDFFDVIPFDDGRVGLVMADVSDKGITAALYMALTRSLLRAEARRSSSPRQVLLNVHDLLMEISRADMFVTVFYGVLDPQQGTLCYARAGHDRPLLVQPSTGQCQFLTSDGMMLGYVDEVVLQEASVPLGPGDLLVLYTDGITNASSPASQFFSVEGLRDVVCSAAGLDALTLCNLVFDCVEEFQAGAAQYDDMALLVVAIEAG